MGSLGTACIVSQLHDVCNRHQLGFIAAGTGLADGAPIRNSQDMQASCGGPQRNSHGITWFDKETTMNLERDDSLPRFEEACTRPARLAQVTPLPEGALHDYHHNLS